MLICRHCGQENPDIARFCLACATPLSRAEGVERRKLATFLFCDMTGSTAMGERLDAESVRDMMFRYFQEMRAVIEHHGGTVDKFIGDAVVAIFGVPVVREDDALRALRAASGMRDRLERLNDELDRRFGHRIAIRIGVNTGEVVAGEQTAQQTLVLGDAVNLAARLEQAAAPGEVLVGDTTFRLARNSVTVEPLEPLELKGKAEPVLAYRLIAVSPPKVHARLAGSTVGREAELEELTRRFEQAVAESAARLVTVVGNPGVGKTHLGAQFVAAIADRAFVLRSNCLSYGEGITFWPLAEIVREAAGVGEDDTPEIARARIGALLAGEESGSVIAERIAQAIGLLGGSAPAEEIDWAFRRLLEVLARERPLVLVIEDVHWAEPALLDLLQSLVGRSAEAAIFVLCVARPELLERRADWETTLSLRPLGRADAELLVEQLLGPGIGAELRGRLVVAAEGNPLFLEELVRMLVDDGVLRPSAGGWTASDDLGEFDIPPTINALLNARLDRLEPSERETLERGAVEGPTFHRDSVAALATVDVPDLPARLASLVRKEFITAARATLSGEEAFDFLHVLIRDATYRTTPKKLRAELHERFATWLEETAGDRLFEYEELVGYHLEQAYRFRSELGPVGEREEATAARATHHLSRSARRAQARGDVAAAANLLSRSLSLVTDDSERADLLVDLARAQSASGDLAAAENTLSEALALAEKVNAGGTAASATIQLASIRFHRQTESTAAQIFDAAEHAMKVFRQFGDERGLARASRTMGYAHLVEGRYGLCARTLQQALEHANAAGDEGEKRAVLSMIGFALWFGPVPVSEAVRHLEELLEDVAGQPISEAALLPPLAGLHAMSGDFGRARALLGRTRVLLGELGLRSQLADTALVGAAVELLAGDLEAAETVLVEGYEILDAMGEKAMLSTLAASLANVHCAQRRFETAEGFLETGERAASADDVVSQARLKCARARLLAHRGLHNDAEPIAREAARIIGDSDALDERANTLAALAEVLALRGKDAESRIISRQALGLYEAKGNRVAAASAAATLGHSTSTATG